MDGAEIMTMTKTRKLYVVGGGQTLYSVDLSDPSNPVQGASIELNATAQSVAVNSGYIAIALSNASDHTQNGTIALYTASTTPHLSQLFQWCPT